MADRLLVVYKTPLQRLTETALIVATAFAAAALWQRMLPGVSSSYIIIAVSALGFMLVPRFGARWANRRGAAIMSTEERNRRYLSELGPVGMEGRFSAYAAICKTEQSRRGGIRSRRRR